MFKLLNKSNRLKLLEIKRPEEVGKSDNLYYCLYHRITKRCYIFKYILQVLINAEVLKLRSEQKKVTTNTTSFLQFGVEPSTPAGVVPIPKGELRVVNTNSHHQQEKDLVPVPTQRGVMWVHLNLVEGQQWTTVTNRKSMGKARLCLAIWCVFPLGKRKLIYLC